MAAVVRASTSNDYIYTEVSLLALVAEVRVTVGPNGRYPYLEEALERVLGFTFPLSHIVETRQNTQGDLISNATGVPQYFLHLSQDVIQYIEDELKHTIEQNGTLTNNFPDPTTMETHADRLFVPMSFYVKDLNGGRDTAIRRQATLATQIERFANACYIQNVTRQTFVIHIAIVNVFPQVSEINFTPENYNHITTNFARRYRQNDQIENPPTPPPHSVIPQFVAPQPMPSQLVVSQLDPARLVWL